MHDNECIVFHSQRLVRREDLKLLQNTVVLENILT